MWRLLFLSAIVAIAGYFSMATLPAAAQQMRRCGPNGCMTLPVPTTRQGCLMNRRALGYKSGAGVCNTLFPRGKR